MRLAQAAEVFRDSIVSGTKPNVWTRIRLHEALKAFKRFDREMALLRAEHKEMQHKLRKLKK